MKSRIQGVAAQMATFNFYFGSSLALYSFYATLTTSASHCKQKTCQQQKDRLLQLRQNSTLKAMRNDDGFWQRVTTMAKNLDIPDPELPHRRKSPCWHDDGCAPAFPLTVKDHYRAICFEALDLITFCIDDRFNQQGYKMYEKVEMLLLKAAASKPYVEELKHVLTFYGDDFDPLQLSTQLEVLSNYFSSKDKVVLSDIIEFFQTSSSGQLELLSQVTKLVSLLLVMPATNAESERSFSAVRQIKSYLRSTMSQQQLNHLMVLHVHSVHTDRLNLVDVANEFIADNKHRRQVFGHEFKETDL